MDTSIPERSGGRRRWPRLLALQALAVLLALLVVEGGVRLVRWVQGEPWSAAAAREALLQARSSNLEFSASAATDWFQDPNKADPSRAMHLQPFFAWEQGVRETGCDRELEFRRSPEHEHAYNLLILGGSVAEIFTIERQGIAPLREVLEADPRFAGKTLHVMPFARGGGKQPQQLNRLTYLLELGLEPDAVIELDGFNEVALGNKNAREGVHPLFPSTAHWAYLASAGAADRTGLDMLLDLRATQQALESACDRSLAWHVERSALLGSFALRRVRALQAARGEQQEACTKYLTGLSDNIVRGPSFTGSPSEAVGECVRGWAQASLTMQDICRARSIHYLHVLQPNLHDEGSKPLSPNEQKGGVMDEYWLEGVQLGYPRLRQAGEWLRGKNVNFLDATQIFAGMTEDIYFDSCHFGKKGNRLLAQAIGRAFLDSLPASPR